MAFTVEDVIEEARDEHPAFTESQTPDRPLLRRINRTARRLFQRTLDIEPTLVSATETITVSSFDFSTGHPLPDYERIIGGDMKQVGEAEPLRDPFKIIPWGQRHRGGARRAGYLRDETLFLQGNSEDWDDIEKIELFYVPVRTELTSESDNPNLPDRAQSPLAMDAAAFMARRGIDGQPLPVYPDMKQEADQEELSYLRWVAQRESQAETATWGTAW